MYDTSPRFLREEEGRLKELDQRISSGEVLSSEERDEHAQLKQRYDAFEEEGMRRLQGRECGAQCEDVIEDDGADGGDLLETLQSTVTLVKKAAYFWGSLVATVVPGYLGRKAGVTPDFLHWNFITDYLILGALPVVTRVGNSGDHLVQICSQLTSSNKELGLVVACLEDEEVHGFGINMITFADEELWRRTVSPEIEYLTLSMADTSANIGLDVVKRAVNKMHICISEKKRVVYVHCKAGKGRSWMVVMCYLIMYEGKSIEDADTLIRTNRPQINPSMEQRIFVAKFARSIHVNEVE